MSRVLSIGTVARVEERHRTEWVSGLGADAVTREVSPGMMSRCNLFEGRRSESE